MQKKNIEFCLLVFGLTSIFFWLLPLRIREYLAYFNFIGTQTFEMVYILDKIYNFWEILAS